MLHIANEENLGMPSIVLPRCGNVDKWGVSVVSAPGLQIAVGPVMRDFSSWVVISEERGDGVRRVSRRDFREMANGRRLTKWLIISEFSRL
jgi:hypothetical protein